MYLIPHCRHFYYDAIRFKFKLFICVLLHSKLKFLFNFARGFGYVSYLWVCRPHITLAQQENQLCPLRFSAWIYPQPGNFHEEHCKGAWLASHVFDALTYNPSQKKKRKQCFSMLLLLSVSWVSVLWSPFVFLYIYKYFLHIFIHFFYLTHNTELYFCYVHMNLCNRAGLFHLLLSSV